MTLLTLLSGASGTAAPVVFTGLYQTTVRRRIDALDVILREGLAAADVPISAPNGSDLLGFGDGSEIGWPISDNNTPITVKRRLGNLKVER